MNNTNIKIVFMGTPQFAVPCLLKLKEADYNLIGVITQPDKPTGRQQKLTPPPVKIEAQKLNLPIYQFNKLDQEAIKKIKELNPDLIIVVAYGKILPAEILALPPHGCLNIHPSLLPHYRGPSPIQTAIFKGEKQTGITIIKLDQKLDHGPIIAQETFDILNDDNAESLSNNLACEGAELLIKILPDYLENKIKSQPQDDSQATFTKIITQEDAKINWRETPPEIDCQIRAFYPSPGAWTNITGPPAEALSSRRAQVGKKVKILKAHLEEGELVIDQVQPESKKAMSYNDYLQGNEPLV